MFNGKVLFGKGLFDKDLFDVFDRLAMMFVSLAVLVCLYILLVYLPIAAIDEGECLSRGYLDSLTTFTLDTYCKNLDYSIALEDLMGRSTKG
jgi:hypothetical protein